MIPRSHYRLQDGKELPDAHADAMPSYRKSTYTSDEGLVKCKMQITSGTVTKQTQ